MTAAAGKQRFHLSQAKPYGMAEPEPMGPRDPKPIVGVSKPSGSRRCPVCGLQIHPAEAVCLGCKGKLSRASRHDLGAAWHRLRSVSSGEAQLAAFGDEAREAVRLSLATKDAA